jgi:3-deoxy-D-manno-octulosonic-acid transferase
LIIASAFNGKIRKGIKGRNHLFRKLNIEISKLGKNEKRIWFHSASMGEFEQAKPIISLLKEKHPKIKIIVSFFSPSGYENNLKYKLSDVITYLPFDSFFNARRFLNTVSPDMAIFMRYDIWPNILWSLSKRNIPTFLVDATMSKESKRKLPVLRSFHRFLFKHFKRILTVSQNDAAGFSFFGCDNSLVQVVGDTRYDQVYTRSLSARSKKILPDEVIKSKKVFIVGSSWKEDEDQIFPTFIKLQETIPDLMMILVPHEPTELNLEIIENELRDKITYIRFSQLMNYNNEKVVIIDCVGLLVSLYAYGDVAYVGGGFGEGIHNVLEPATYFIPVLFGPRNKNSQEAQILMKIGGGFEIKNKNDITDLLQKFFNNGTIRKEAGIKAGTLVKENIGATEKIYQYLKEYI